MKVRIVLDDLFQDVFVVVDEETVIPPDKARYLLLLPPVRIEVLGGFPLLPPLIIDLGCLGLTLKLLYLL